MVKITFDTNVLPIEDLNSLVKDKPIKLSVVSVTSRELEKHSLAVELKKLNKITETAVWDESKWGQAKWGPVIYETAVVGESRVGESVVGSNKDVDVFEKLLEIISSGSFPKSGKRNDLSKGERRQLRDAMILTAHIREKRDIFVTEDIKGFIGRNSEIKKKIENLFKTKIMRKKEFIKYLSNI
ncbi:hypothetical protein KKD61_03955 [Patescibacteria group bacterium]|nr:hypothetical protein [Patescibacteria group bacterium]